MTATPIGVPMAPRTALIKVSDLAAGDQIFFPGDNPSKEQPLKVVNLTAVSHWDLSSTVYVLVFVGESGNQETVFFDDSTFLVPIVIDGAASPILTTPVVV